MIYPPPLQKGDCIGVMSTSCWIDEQELLAAQNFAQTLGYKVYIHPQTTNRFNQSAGSAQDKIDAFHDLIRNPDIKAIVGSRGGNRALTMIDSLDFDLIKQNPKILMGYSDVTFLLNAIYAKTGIIGYHAPLFREWGGHKNIEAIRNTLCGEKNDTTLRQCDVIQSGQAQGALIGGNLSVINTLIGTPYLPDMNGTLLFLEDVGDHLSRYDRMFGALRLSGVLDQISALVIGQFTDMQDSDHNPFGFSLKECVLEHIKGRDIPLIMDAPFGHGKDLPAFPVGAHIKLTASEDTVILKPL